MPLEYLVFSVKKKVITSQSKNILKFFSKKIQRAKCLICNIYLGVY
jgi:hypothetical protein